LRLPAGGKIADLAEGEGDGPGDTDLPARGPVIGEPFVAQGGGDPLGAAADRGRDAAVLRWPLAEGSAPTSS
jgi:hypothetical protein